jgi:hypothetical protein
MSCLPELRLVRAFNFRNSPGASPTSECISQVICEDDEPCRSCTWLTDGWESCVHPEGALYLYNDSLVSIQSYACFHGRRNILSAENVH